MVNSSQERETYLTIVVGFMDATVMLCWIVSLMMLYS